MIIKIAPTSAGIRERSKWDAFASNLMSKAFSHERIKNQFSSYLSYAFALGVDDIWFERASKSEAYMPNWFYISETVDGTASSSRTFSNVKKDFEDFLDLLGGAFGFKGEGRPPTLRKQILSLGIVSFLSLKSNVLNILVIPAGIFAFLDAWTSGIYRKRNVRYLPNMAPSAWGISMVLAPIIFYPLYLMNS